MEASTAAITSLAVNTLTGANLGDTEEKFSSAKASFQDNHVLHFNNLPKYLVLDIVDLLKSSKIDDWTLYNKDKDTILSFRPEIKSNVEAFYDNLKGCQVAYHRMSL